MQYSYGYTGEGELYGFGDGSGQADWFENGMGGGIDIGCGDCAGWGSGGIYADEDGNGGGDGDGFGDGGGEASGYGDSWERGDGYGRYFGQNMIGND